MNSSHSNDNQFMRRIFDALYDFSPEAVISSLAGMSKRTRWILISIISGFVLLFVLLQFASIGVEAYKWSQRTPLNDRLLAPYGLTTRSVPVINPAMLDLHEIQTIDVEKLEADRAAYLEETYASALVEAQAAFDAAVAAGEVITPEMAAELEAQAIADAEAAGENPTGDTAEGETGAEEPAAPVVATVEDFLPEFDEEALRLAIMPDIDVSYFMVLKDVEAFTRVHIFPNVNMHPVINCLSSVEVEMAESCGLETLPTFIEGADYFDAEGNQVRLVATHYASAEEATDSIRTLRHYSRSVGTLGNYSVADLNDVKYFFGSSRGYRTLVWSSGEWVFSISTENQRVLQTFAQNVTF